jgi:hypothetical protein
LSRLKPAATFSSEVSKDPAGWLVFLPFSFTGRTL